MVAASSGSERVTTRGSHGLRLTTRQAPAERGGALRRQGILLRPCPFLLQCYYIGATDDAATKIINEVSKPLAHHIPVEKICEKLKKKDSQICELKYGEWSGLRHRPSATQCQRRGVIHESPRAYVAEHGRRC